MNICSERYFKLIYFKLIYFKLNILNFLSQNEYSKIKEFIDNNIDTVEAILAPMHELFDLSKKCYGNYCYCPCHCHCKKNNRKCVCLTDKYSEFCTEDSIIVKKITKSYLNVEYIKYLYLLQKAADQIISKKLNLYDENTCIHETDMLITMFINLYHSSNIDCNKKV